MIQIEPKTMAPRFAFAGGRWGQRALFNAGLAYVDQHEVAQPLLADSLPQLNTDTWRVFPDGRMETLYRLGDGLTWHDGVPFTAEDVAFTRRVARANPGPLPAPARG